MCSRHSRGRQGLEPKRPQLQGIVASSRGVLGSWEAGIYIIYASTTPALRQHYASTTLHYTTLVVLALGLVLVFE